MKKNLLLIVDSDEKSGLGHLARSIEYAKPFTHNQFNVELECQIVNEKIRSLLEKTSINVVQGSYIEERKDCYGIIIVDSYRIGESDIKKIRKKYKNAIIAQIVDMPGVYTADVIISYTLEANCIKNVGRVGKILTGIEYNPIGILRSSLRDNGEQKRNIEYIRMKEYTRI